MHLLLAGTGINASSLWPVRTAAPVLAVLPGSSCRSRSSPRAWDQSSSFSLCLRVAHVETFTPPSGRISSLSECAHTWGGWGGWPLTSSQGP